MIPFDFPASRLWRLLNGNHFAFASVIQVIPIIEHFQISLERRPVLGVASTFQAPGLLRTQPATRRSPRGNGLIILRQLNLVIKGRRIQVPDRVPAASVIDILIGAVQAGVVEIDLGVGLLRQDHGLFKRQRMRVRVCLFRFQSYP